MPVYVLRPGGNSNVPGEEVTKHLDLHFRLLRHDLVAPLAETLQHFRDRGGIRALGGMVNLLLLCGCLRCWSLGCWAAAALPGKELRGILCSTQHWCVLRPHREAGGHT